MSARAPGDCGCGHGAVHRPHTAAAVRPCHRCERQQRWAEFAQEQNRHELSACGSLSLIGAGFSWSAMTRTLLHITCAGNSGACVLCVCVCVIHAYAYCARLGTSSLRGGTSQGGKAVQGCTTRVVQGCPTNPSSSAELASRLFPWASPPPSRPIAAGVLCRLLWCSAAISPVHIRVKAAATLPAEGLKPGCPHEAVEACQASSC